MTNLPAFDWAINLLIVQGAMGAFDTIYHHELTQRLPLSARARQELTIHAVRAVLYGVVFAGIANLRFLGLWTFSIAILVLAEIALTLWDFVEEDRSRKLPATERILHTLLAINGGALFGLYALQLSEWFHAPTALVIADTGWRGLALSLFAMGVAASGLRDGIAAYKMARCMPADNPFADQPHLHVLVTGGTGFIGEALVTHLLDAGHSVTVLTRDPLRAAYLFGGRARCVTAISQLHREERFDVVINLAGAPVLGPRWSEQRRAELLASRVGVTQELVKWVNAAAYRPPTWIQASAIGYYGARPADEPMAESSTPGCGFMSELCQLWENSARPLDNLGIRSVVIRLGVVFGPGGALPPMLLPYYFGVGGHLGTGSQVLSWIHRDDVLRVIARAISNLNMRGVYNATAPAAVTQAEFAQAAGKVLRRPVWLHLPATPLRWAAGEMSELLLAGQRVVPDRLQQERFEFRFPTIEPALRSLR